MIIVNHWVCRARCAHTVPPWSLFLAPPCACTPGKTARWSPRCNQLRCWMSGRLGTKRSHVIRWSSSPCFTFAGWFYPKIFNFSEIFSVFFYVFGFIFPKNIQFDMDNCASDWTNSTRLRVMFQIMENNNYN